MIYPFRPREVQQSDFERLAKNFRLSEAQRAEVLATLEALGKVGDYETTLGLCIQSKSDGESETVVFGDEEICEPDFEDFEDFPRPAVAGF